MLDWNDIEIIQSQDHFYWLYSNSKNKYYPTPFHWKTMSETEFRKKYQNALIPDDEWIDDFFN